MVRLEPSNNLIKFPAFSFDFITFCGQIYNLESANLSCQAKYIMCIVPDKILALFWITFSLLVLMALNDV
jgi:hypothetical protein